MQCCYFNFSKVKEQTYNNEETFKTRGHIFTSVLNREVILTKEEKTGHIAEVCLTL